MKINFMLMQIDLNDHQNLSKWVVLGSVDRIRKGNREVLNFKPDCRYLIVTEDRGNNSGEKFSMDYEIPICYSKQEFLDKIKEYKFKKD